jgi:hypothetical protein
MLLRNGRDISGPTLEQRNRAIKSKGSKTQAWVPGLTNQRL